MWRDWVDADDRVSVEMRDDSDAHLYEQFRARHPELPKFRRTT